MSNRGLSPVPLLRASGARCWVGGSPPQYPPLRPLALGAGCRSGDNLVVVHPVLGPRAPSARWGPPSGSSGPPRRGYPAGTLGGPPPLPRWAPGARTAGWGFPPSLPPPLDARVRRARSFRGGPRLCRLVSHVRLLARAPYSFVPPLRPLCGSDRRRRPCAHWASHRRGRSRSGEVCWRVPGVVIAVLLGRRGPRGDWDSHRRGHSCSDGVCFREPRAPGSRLRPRLHLRLRLRVLHHRRAPWRRAVSTIS